VEASRRVPVGQRLGRGADALFSAAQPEPAPTPAAAALQPAGEVRQTAVWLSDAETGWLDERVVAAKRACNRRATRSSLIRELIQAAMRQHRDTDVLENANTGTPARS
jgi:hypothetical protein